MQQQDSAARGRQLYAAEQLFDGAGNRRGPRCDDRIEDLVIAKVFWPSPFFLQEAKGCAAGDAEHPWPEQFRRRQPPKLPINDEQDLLRDVVRMKWTDQAAEVSTQRWLNGAQKQLDRIPIAGLRP